jgi:hypothetical protein
MGAKLTYAVVNCRGNSESQLDFAFSYSQVTFGGVEMGALANLEFVRKAANLATK